MAEAQNGAGKEKVYYFGRYSYFSTMINDLIIVVRSEMSEGCVSFRHIWRGKG